MDCKQCGGCCRKMIIEIEHLDIVREPRLQKCADVFADHYILPSPCPFLTWTLGGKKRCSIYPTRPNVCVAFEAGGEQCLEFRE
jgi:Fe-S-cluster containining protein